MKVSRLFFAAAVALSLSSAPSFAGNPNIDEHYWHARLQAQVLNETPLVSIHLHPGNLPQTYVIEAPQQAQPANPPQMIRPSQNAPNVTIIHSGLPDAGFQSAINPGNQARMANNLPSGMSTNMLAGKMISPALKPVSARPNAINSTPKAALLQSPPQTLTYPNQPSSGGVSSWNAKTSVTGSLQRGSLLANQAHHQ